MTGHLKHKTLGDDLLEMTHPVFWENKEIISFLLNASSALKALKMQVFSFSFWGNFILMAFTLREMWELTT